MQGGHVAVATSSLESPARAVQDAAWQVEHVLPELLLYFASPRERFDAIARAVWRRFPDAASAGCTTMGELGPGGFAEHSLVLLAIGPPGRASARLVPSLVAHRLEEGHELVRGLAGDLGLSPEALSPSRHVFVTLTDGLSGGVERLLQSVRLAAPGIPLLGGSAGDGERFAETRVALDGRTVSGGAVVLLLEPGGPFRPFLLTHLHPTAERVVVTEAEPAQRLVQGLNGRPAVEVLAELLGVSLAELRERPLEQLSRGGVHFGYVSGGVSYTRSVMTVRGDALLLGGAVEEGAVLALLEAGELVEETRRGLERALADFRGRPAALLLFNCGGRLLEARAAGVLDELGRAMTPLPAAGFSTYGEQFGALQVNHTLTGLVLGEPGSGG